MFGTLRSSRRHYLPAVAGTLAVIGAFGLLQTGMTSSGSRTTDSAQLAAVANRTNSHAANRGSGRSGNDSANQLAEQTATVNGVEGRVSPAGEPDPTTTTAAPTTTTTQAPTTQSSPATQSSTVTVQASQAQATVQAQQAPRPSTPKPQAQSVAQPAPSQPAVESTPSKPVDDDVWKRLAMCESGMRNDGGAPYYGYFQFSPQTWTSLGGPGLPNSVDYETQKAFAIKLQARSGWGQWPVCSKKALAG